MTECVFLRKSRRRKLSSKRFSLQPSNIKIKCQILPNLFNVSYHFPCQLQAAAYEISDPSVLTPTALAYVRARNADPMCSFGDFAAISHIVDVATAMV